MTHKKVWLVCSECGYNLEVFENEAYNFGECSICGGRMVLDINNGNKLEEPIGDNFPKIDKEMDNWRKQNLPLITQSEIEDFRIDLETLPITEIFKRIEVYKRRR